jgi:hypothetical protein
MLNDLTCYKILPGLFSDHSILKITLGNQILPRGRGMWKFNVNLLHDHTFIKNIKEIVKNCTTELSDTSDKGLSWELVKLKIRNFCVPYCINKKKERNNFKKNLEKEHRCQ